MSLQPTIKTGAPPCQKLRERFLGLLRGYQSIFPRKQYAFWGGMISFHPVPPQPSKALFPASDFPSSSHSVYPKGNRRGFPFIFYKAVYYARDAFSIINPFGLSALSSEESNREKL